MFSKRKDSFVKSLEITCGYSIINRQEIIYVIHSFFRLIDRCDDQLTLHRENFNQKI